MLSHLTIGATLYTGDMLYVVVSFLILLGLVWMVVWKPVNEMMKTRADKIASDIDSAESSKQDAAKLAKQRQDELANSHQEAASIMSDAKAAGQKQSAQIVADAQGQVTTMKQNAQKDIEQERQDALASARGDVADLSIEIASKLLQKELNADDQKALVDSYIEGLGK